MDSPPARGSVERSACTRDIVHETRVVDDERIFLLVSSILFEPGEHASLCIAPVVALQSLLARSPPVVEDWSRDEASPCFNSVRRPEPTVPLLHAPPSRLQESNTGAGALRARGL